MGLNDSYEQARGKILMMVPLSSLNKTYSLLIERESQHTISQTASSSNGFELSAMFTTGNMSNQVSRPKSSYDPNAFCYHCKRTGSCQVTPKDTINIVLLVPDFEFNLLSISQITKDLKCTVCFFPDFVVIQDLSNGQVKEIGREHVGLYLMPNHTSPIQITPQCSSHLAHGSISSSTESQALLWHQKLGHTSSSILAHLLAVSPTQCSKDLHNCTICPLAKQHRLSFPNSNTVSTCSFQLLHIDVWGTFNTPTFDGNRFFVTIVDDCTRLLWVFLIKLKSDVCVVLKNFLIFARTQFNAIVKIVRTDNGSKFVNDECHKLFTSLDSTHQRTCIHTPQQNGIAERKHKHILEVARAIRFQRSHPYQVLGSLCPHNNIYH